MPSLPTVAPTPLFGLRDHQLDTGPPAATERERRKLVGQSSKGSGATMPRGPVSELTVINSDLAASLKLKLNVASRNPGHGPSNSNKRR